MKQAKEVADI